MAELLNLVLSSLLLTDFSWPCFVNHGPVGRKLLYTKTPSCSRHKLWRFNKGDGANEHLEHSLLKGGGQSKDGRRCCFALSGILPILDTRWVVLPKYPNCFKWSLSAATFCRAHGTRSPSKVLNFYGVCWYFVPNSVVLPCSLGPNSFRCMYHKFALVKTHFYYTRHTF